MALDDRARFAAAERLADLAMKRVVARAEACDPNISEKGEPWHLERELQGEAWREAVPALTTLTGRYYSDQVGDQALSEAAQAALDETHNPRDLQGERVQTSGLDLSVIPDLPVTWDEGPDFEWHRRRTREWLVGWFFERRLPKEHRFESIAAVLDLSLPAPAIWLGGPGAWSWLWGSESLPDRSWVLRVEPGEQRPAALLRAISKAPLSPLAHDSERMPVLWMDASVRAHFEFEARSVLEQLHEQLIGFLLVVGLAEEAIPPDMIAVLLGQWPGGSVDNSFPSQAMRHKALRTVRAEPEPILHLSRRDIHEVWISAVFGRDDEDARVVRTALANYARGCLEDDPGEACTRYAMCLEGLLLDKDGKESAVARVQEAAAHHLGGRKAIRDAHRKLVDDLYKVRSRYVHTGGVDAKEVKRPIPQLRAEARAMVSKALRRAIDWLVPSDAERKG